MDLRGLSKQIESSDIIRLILQFLKESNLRRTLQCLQEESGVALNAVDNIESFHNDIIKGKWDSVLQIVGTMRVPEETLYLLYQQIIGELLEAREFTTALIMLRDTSTMQAFKISHPQKYRTWDTLAQSGRMKFDKKELYNDNTKEKQRMLLAKSLSEILQQATPSRLVTLLGMALKWQHENGLLPTTGKYDLFRGAIVGEGTSTDPRVENIVMTIKLGKASPPQCVTFSPNGKYLVTGSSDGLIEIWDWITGELSSELQYQQEDILMAHEAAVLSIAFNNASEQLVSGCQDGDIKVWDIYSGKCIKKFIQVHDKGISCLSFNSDGTQILSGSYDHTAKLHGLHSGKTLRVFQGHTSYVNGAIFNGDESRVITVCSDGCVKIWDTKLADCLLTFSPPPPIHLNENVCLSINSIFLAPKTSSLPIDTLFVCTKSNTLYLMTLSGGILKKFSTGRKSGSDFVAACVSPTSSWIYCVAEDYSLYTFSTTTGKLEGVNKIHEKDIIGITHHPTHNMLATISFDGCLHLLQP